MLINDLFSTQYYENIPVLIKRIIDISNINSLFVLNDTTILNQEDALEISQSSNNDSPDSTYSLISRGADAITNFRRRIDNYGQIYDVRPSDVTNLLKENVRYCATQIKSDLFRNDIVLTKNVINNDIVLFDENITQLSSKYLTSQNKVVKRAFFYTELQLSPRYTSRNQIENSDFVFYSTEDASYVTFNRSFLREYLQNLNVTIENNRIVANISEREIFFERFSRDYYRLISMLLNPTMTRNRRFLRSEQSNEVSLVVKNIFFRVCIILNIENIDYTILKNVPIIPKNTLLEYAQRNSINYVEDYLNINFLDERLDIFMPNITYRGVSRWY